MEFRLLGPLGVVESDRSLAGGGREQRWLLAVLPLHGNDAVSRERLVDEPWGESPPATVDKASTCMRPGCALAARHARARLVALEPRIDPIWQLA